MNKTATKYPKIIIGEEIDTIITLDSEGNEVEFLDPNPNPAYYQLVQTIIGSAKPVKNNNNNQ